MYLYVRKILLVFTQEQVSFTEDKNHAQGRLLSLGITNAYIWNMFVTRRPPHRALQLILITQSSSTTPRTRQEMTETYALQQKRFCREDSLDVFLVKSSPPSPCRFLDGPCAVGVSRASPPRLWIPNSNHHAGARRAEDAFRSCLTSSSLMDAGVAPLDLYKQALVARYEYRPQ